MCKKPLFTGKTKIEHIDKIFSFDTPDDRTWSRFNKLPKVAAMGSRYVPQPQNMLREKLSRELLSSDGFRLLSELLTFDPDRRI